MVLPLVDHESSYNVYKLEVQSSMSVQNHVETDLIAVSSNKNQFALISDFERFYIRNMYHCFEYEE